MDPIKAKQGQHEPHPKSSFFSSFNQAFLWKSQKEIISFQELDILSKYCKF